MTNDVKVSGRWIHLDFHTSPLIPGIGKDFDPELFASTLREAAVDSITLFALCHHGQAYYPSRTARRHPHLDRDLFGEMVQACRAQGINTVAYITVVWNEQAGDDHPDWRQIAPDGRLVGRTPLAITGTDWQWMCMNNPAYLDYLEAVTREVLTGYEIDGIFYDIVKTVDPGCVCPHCMRSMKREGLHPLDEGDLRKHSLAVGRRLMERMSAVVRSHDPALSIYYNSRLRLNPDIAASIRPELPYYTHLEIESLPSGEWGYNHFPLYVRFFRNLGVPVLGMTGRFHKSWADFGGLKNEAALEFECFQMIAHGAACSIGDQLHPSGRLDKTVYERIGQVYRSVAEKEPWCRGSAAVTDIGVLLANLTRGSAFGTMTMEEGILQMLQEAHHQFDLIDEEADFNRYRLLIAGDDLRPTPQLTEKLVSFLRNGGRLIASHEAMLDRQKREFTVPFGVRYEGDYPFTPSYIAPDPELLPAIAPWEYVMYEAAAQITAEPGTEVLARIGKPYFNRTYDAFCSHQHSPLEEVTGVPAMTRNGNVVYIAASIFRAYKLNGNQVYKMLVLEAIDLLLLDPAIKTNAPSTAIVTVMDQPGRRIVHLLHYVPQRRSPKIDIIEDRIPLHHVAMQVRLPEAPLNVKLVPQRVDVDYDWADGYVRLVVPEVNGHQMIALEYG